MFSRKQKGSDMANSVARFVDVHRDCFSRVKHLKLLLDSLSLHEKRQLIEEYSFETFHLVDELLLSCDVTNSPQAAVEAESGLWTLEQLMCLAPELVESGWQKHAIECLLKKAIYPHNLLSVRKIAIRLFLIFYQSLAVNGNGWKELDRVFQCLLPYFPLRSGENTEMILQEYCQAAGNTQWAMSSKTVGTGTLHGKERVSNAKERAQLLQVYLDKFLEYCSRETMRIEWSDDGKRKKCADFIIDRVIKMYIHETFPDLEVNGVDIFGGWVGNESEIMPVDTGDPVVIARYWLIRWMTNIASATQQPTDTTHNGLLLLHQALFSSHKATNTLLSLMSEAMRMPLPCSNVIGKVVNVASSWLLQSEIAPFVANGEVTIEACSDLLIHTLLSFFNSPYLDDPDERIKMALSLSFNILRTCRLLASPSLQLPKALPPPVWSNLISRLADCSARLSSFSEKFSSEIAGPMAGTLFTLIVVCKAVRRLPIEDRLWEDCRTLLEKSVWVQTTEQWAKVLNAVTRAMVLHVIGLDLFTREEANSRQATQVRRLREKAATESTTVLGEENTNEVEMGEDSVFVDSDDITAAVTCADGDSTLWLCTWRRMCLLMNASGSPAGKVAATTLSNTAVTLFNLGLHSLGTWLVQLLLSSPSTVFPLCLPSFVSCLNCPSSSPILHSSCLVAISNLLPSSDPSLLSSLLSLRPLHLSLISHPLLSSLPRSTPSQPPDELLSILSQLALSHTAAEAWLLRQLAGSDISLKQAALVANSLSLLSIVRGDASLASRVMTAVVSGRTRGSLLLLLTSSVPLLARSGYSSQVVDMLLTACQHSKDDKVRTEIQSTLVALVLSNPCKQLSPVVSCIRTDNHRLLESALISRFGQFPLPSFTVTQFHSTLPASLSSKGEVFVRKESVLLSTCGTSPGEIVSRTRLGRHSWTLSPLPSARIAGNKVNSWLTRCAGRPRKEKKEGTAILGGMVDGLECLGRPPPRSSIQSTQLLSLIKSSMRTARSTTPIPASHCPSSSTESSPRGMDEWRAMAITLGHIDQVVRIPPTFSRNVKHLDQTPSRERHKVAVVYVGMGQEDKHSILSNNHSSAAFNNFVDGLGWESRVGEEGVYSGGLSTDTTTTYYASERDECVFHVSTRMGGDVTQKMKHIGNDEVHVVWNEHCRPYRRERLATQFCDVLFVLERASQSWLRVKIQTQSQLDISPLWDGVVIPEEDAPTLIRSACLNASRAYRLSRDTVRPLRHRERVFEEETRPLETVPLSEALFSLYVGTMAECH